MRQQSPKFCIFSFCCCCCCCWLLSSLVVWPRFGGPFVCQNPREVCVTFSRTDVGQCIYHLFVRSNRNFLYNSQWIPFPTLSCLDLCPFLANLLHSVITWLIVSFQSSHNLNLRFCCILSILTLIRFVRIALFRAAIRRDSVSLLKFLFLATFRFSRVICC